MLQNLSASGTDQVSLQRQMRSTPLSNAWFLDLMKPEIQLNNKK
jgi:hypothetical protein